MCCITEGCWESIALLGDVISYQSLRQFKHERLEHILPYSGSTTWLEVLQQNEGIHHPAVKGRPEHVSVVETKEDKLENKRCS